MVHGVARAAHGGFTGGFALEREGEREREASHHFELGQIVLTFVKPLNMHVVLEPPLHL